MRQAGVMPALPTPFRAALGVVATMLDNAKDFPDKAIELPMLAVSTALQMSLRAQQRYAALAAKGDDLLAGRRTTDEPPAWATFDDDPVLPVSKSIRKPRKGAPSAFDAIGDED
jgi:hypothetical protein